jgi:hypothetical protein
MMSANKWFEALLALFEKPKSIQQNHTEKTTKEPEQVLQLTNEVHDKERNDEYLPRGGDSLRAVKPVFSTNINKK